MCTLLFNSSASAVVVRHLTHVVLLLQQLVLQGNAHAVVQLYVIPLELVAVVVHHLTVVVLLLQKLLLIGNAQHTLLFSSS
jgi:hypothetical protein